MKYIQEYTKLLSYLLKKISFSSTVKCMSYGTHIVFLYSERAKGKS